jgi:indole-3-glycerol phosphate synthase
MTILEKIAEYAKERVKEAKKICSAEEMQTKAYEIRQKELAERENGDKVPKFPCKTADFTFEKALKKPGLSFICECKKASPSKGLIAEEYPYREIAKEYEAAGADCISVLTEPRWFLGSTGHLNEIAAEISIPCLRKDFTVDEYMIYEAKLLGASAVLLICALLDEEKLHRYIDICDSLGISALVEAHDENEVKTALLAGARVVGVNNRNLKDFTVDTENSRRLRELIPKDVVFVSESGVKNAEDIRKLKEIGADAVLVGETLMRAPDKRAKLLELKG